jgi:hypothetical protein
MDSPVIMQKTIVIESVSIIFHDIATLNKIFILCRIVASTTGARLAGSRCSCTTPWAMGIFAATDVISGEVVTRRG